MAKCVVCLQPVLISEEIYSVSPLLVLSWKNSNNIKPVHPSYQQQKIMCCHAKSGPRKKWTCLAKMDRSRLPKRDWSTFGILLKVDLFGN